MTKKTKMRDYISEMEQLIEENEDVKDVEIAEHDYEWNWQC